MILQGIIGNVISIITLGKLTHQSSLTFLLRALAVIDFCILLGEVVRVLSGDSTIFYVDSWLYTVADVLWPYRRAYIHPLMYMALLANILTSVFIGMNRYIVVCRPLQAARLCTISIARKQVIFAVLFSVLAMLPTFFECQLKKTENGSVYIFYTLEHNKWYNYIYRVGFCFIFGSLIPFSSLSSFCVRIIITLRAARRQPIDRHGNRIQETRVTSMVLVILGSFIFCHIYWWFKRLCVNFLTDKFYRHVWDTYGSAFGDLLLILNSSINWWIYFVYIKEFRGKLCQKCCYRSETIQAYGML